MLPGITGIGYGPYTSPLGMYGLGGGGTFSAYGDPASMGYYSPYGMMGMSGMMGYYPAFMGQMNQVYQNIEKSQLQHTGDMHELLLKNQTRAFTEQDRAIFEKAMVDAGVNHGIENLSKKIKEGDQDGICEEFDKLKQTLYQKYGDYFKANSDVMNPSDSVNQFIEILYGKIRSQQEGKIVDLRSDIKKYGESAFEHGFWKNLHGKDYHDKYTEETMSYLFGTSIDNKAGKDRMEKLGGTVESAVEYAAAPVVGALAGAGAVTTAAGLGKMLSPDCISKHITWNGFKKAGKVGAWVGAGLALLGDIWWQNSRA